MKASAFLILYFIFLTQGILAAQEIVSSGGDYFTTVNGSMSSTIGEPVSETLKVNEYILTQGFQQSIIFLMVDFDEKDKTELCVHIYPNPAIDYLKVKVENAGTQTVSYNLRTAEGKLLLEGRFNSPETEITVNQLPAATYFLKIYTDQEEIKAYKVIKQ
jgi:hypothetical protein